MHVFVCVYLYITDNDEQAEPEPQGHPMSHTARETAAQRGAGQLETQYWRYVMRANATQKRTHVGTSLYVFCFKAFPSLSHVCFHPFALVTLTFFTAHKLRNVQWITCDPCDLIWCRLLWASTHCRQPVLINQSKFRKKKTYIRSQLDGEDFICPHPSTRETEFIPLAKQIMARYQHMCWLNKT